jgi:tripartite-type tricarboxylate transporter receptor subunit TctC
MLAVSARAGIHGLHVPYNAAAQIATDVIGEHIDLVVAGLPSLLPLVQHGKLKAFAVMSHDRDIGDMDIPSLGDTPGMQGLDFGLWTGVFAPKKTPKAILDQANHAFAQALQDPALIRTYRTMGVKVADPITPEKFSAFVNEDLIRLKATVKQEGIEPK